MPRIYGHFSVHGPHHHRPHCHPHRPVVVVAPVAPRPIVHRPTSWFHRPAGPVVLTQSVRPIVATGVTATIAGIALMILGACLLPISFGASIGLIIAGGLVTAGGTGALIYSRR